VAALNPAKSPIRVADLTFQDGAGKERKLGDWANKTVLLNLWATWCVPCKKEMPALDELQKKLGGADFEVVAVNIDTRDPQKPKTWLKDTGISSLAFYADPTARIFQDLKEKGRAFGMPTTLLIDKNGCEVATLAGPAEWASGDAIKFIEKALGR
jgi:thiol-disulfide isomerase/thioredoxin